MSRKTGLLGKLLGNFIVLLLACLPRSVDAGTLWPVPTNISLSCRQLYFHPRLKFSFEDKTSEILSDAFDRYTERILDNSIHWNIQELSDLTSDDAIRRVSVFVVSSDQSLGLQTSTFRIPYHAFSQLLLINQSTNTILNNR